MTTSENLVLLKSSLESAMLGNLVSMGIGTFGLVLTPVAFLGVAFTVTVLDFVLALIGGRRHLENDIPTVAVSASLLSGLAFGSFLCYHSFSLICNGISYYRLG